ncbi:MAG: glycosyltransferase [Planctomycetes bacterium]|nr:glycosyltransferase [Planctomycetota bacterium]
MPDTSESPPPVRVALAHHWLMSMRGGEKTVSVLAGMFPDAPVYALLANRDQLDTTLRQRDIRCSWLQRFNWISSLQRKALPLLTAAARSMDATAYDVVICSDAAVIKAIRTRPGALKICYCHTPMRYVWDLYDEYYRQAGPLGRLGLRLAAPRLREQDRLAADTVDAFVANSRHVADRIRRHYGRPSIVIAPPVDVVFPPPLPEPDDYYLVVSELVHYKRVDLAVEACGRLGRPLVVIGAGPLLGDIRRRAAGCIHFLGWQSDEVVRGHLRRCRALLFCGEEDFGLTPVEAMAAGRPVIAYRAGGATETVLDGCTGLFFDEPKVDALANTIERFERGVGPASSRSFDAGKAASGVGPASCRSGAAELWPADRIQAHARQFGVDLFRQRFASFYDWCLRHHRQGGAVAIRRAMEDVDPMSFAVPP